MHRALAGRAGGRGLEAGRTEAHAPGRRSSVIGGMSDRAIERTVKWGIGWTVGGAPPETGGPFAERIRAAWKEAGREGQPRVVGLTYFSLGHNALEAATAYLSDYYGDMGNQIARFIPKTPHELRDTVKRFAEYGFDELFLDPVSHDLRQVDLAAAAAL